MTRLTVNEIFTSLQGETTESGRPCTFGRLTACDLRCSGGATPHAFDEGEKLSLDEILADVASRGVSFVTVTGGEPLLPAGCTELVRSLLDGGCQDQAGTGG